jgi:hypothetical protein
MTDLIITAFLHAWLIAVLLAWAAGLLVLIAWALLLAWGFVLAGWDMWKGRDNGRAI